MKFMIPALVAAGLVAAPAFASGDVEKGKRAFNQCQTCHIVADAAGNTLAGRAAKTGPNLYGVIGRQAGTAEGFGGYGDSLVQAGVNGLAWDEYSFVAYVQDPTGYLREVLGDKKARGKMSFKVRKESDAEDLYAFLVSLAQ